MSSCPDPVSPKPNLQQPAPLKAQALAQLRAQLLRPRPSPVLRSSTQAQTQAQAQPGSEPGCSGRIRSLPARGSGTPGPGDPPAAALWPPSWAQAWPASPDLEARTALGRGEGVHRGGGGHRPSLPHTTSCSYTPCPELGQRGGQRAVAARLGTSDQPAPHSPHPPCSPNCGRLPQPGASLTRAHSLGLHAPPPRTAAVGSRGAQSHRTGPDRTGTAFPCPRAEPGPASPDGLTPSLSVTLEPHKQPARLWPPGPVFPAARGQHPSARLPPSSRRREDREAQPSQPAWTPLGPSLLSGPKSLPPPRLPRVNRRRAEARSPRRGTLQGPNQEELSAEPPAAMARSERWPRRDLPRPPDRRPEPSVGD